MKRESTSSNGESTDQEQQVVLHGQADASAGRTRVGKNNLRKVDAEGAGAQEALLVRRIFFPDWFGAETKDISGKYDSQESYWDSPKLINFTVPKFPEWKPINIDLFDEINQ